MEIDESYLKHMENQSADDRSKLIQMSQIANSMYSGSQDPNLIEWQLELDNILERVEHLLAGDLLKVTPKGDTIWQKQQDDDLVPLNEYGVQLVMNILAFYLNRNTILSNYDEKRIKRILYDMGWDLNDLMYTSAEKMGMDTKEKRRRYSMIFISMLHMVESAYNRAFQGEEKESLRTARVVTQSDNFLNSTSGVTLMQKPRSRGGSGGGGGGFSWLNPSSWVR